MNDPDLEALRAGDEEAFTALVRRHHGAMLAMSMSYVRSPSVAEEVVQETWLTVLRTLDRFEGRSSFKTWIFGILINLSRARRRQESRFLSASSLVEAIRSRRGGPTVSPRRFGADGIWSDPPRPWAGLPEATLLSRETLDRVRAAIDALPARQREVIVLRDVAGWTANEVCSVLGITPANHRVRLHRARAAVRRALEDYLT